MKVFATALIAASAFAQAASNHWAVIVAGSNGYWNYRH
jgi:glycosylphosphatidylinositol transamidase (GPIT) subunit GPI8